MTPEPDSDDKDFTQPDRYLHQSDNGHESPVLQQKRELLQVCRLSNVIEMF